MADLIRLGPFPSEDDDQEDLERIGELLLRISTPVTDEEAYALLSAFGSDDCYGMTGTLLHVIETAPNITSMTFPRNTGKLGIDRLIARQENWLDSIRERDEGDLSCDADTNRLRPANSLDSSVSLMG
ncbi:hypothetical protein L0U85_12055 [Glycomyces sp. L485]|uniref:hypothetical protein n=1 Tax=Glycomyces sp. L485 TaxID=2909235 RepID=UPI001F4AED49|nr:hypothetical protein [Glycomyces sp. L485]MCH7231577.1 hypothetical protein [Glycomyces sp. L485]